MNEDDEFYVAIDRVEKEFLDVPWYDRKREEKI